MCFYFYRIVLRDITGIPLCPITQWGYTQEMCSFCLRIGIFHLLIQDWIRFQTRSNEFNMYEAYLQFSRVYWHFKSVSAFFVSRSSLNKVEDLRASIHNGLIQMKTFARTVIGYFPLTWMNGTLNCNAVLLSVGRLRVA